MVLLKKYTVLFERYTVYFEKYTVICVIIRSSTESIRFSNRLIISESYDVDSGKYTVLKLTHKR